MSCAFNVPRIIIVDMDQGNTANQRLCERDALISEMHITSTKRDSYIFLCWKRNPYSSHGCCTGPGIFLVPIGSADGKLGHSYRLGDTSGESNSVSLLQEGKTEKSH